MKRTKIKVSSKNGCIISIDKELLGELLGIPERCIKGVQWNGGTDSLELVINTDLPGTFSIMGTTAQRRVLISSYMVGHGQQYYRVDLRYKLNELGDARS